jgi:HlyD family secretion protein
MATPELKLTPATGQRMDRKVQRNRWSPASWPLAAKAAAGGGTLLLVALVLIKLIAGSQTRTLRLPQAQASFATVQQGIFHDLIPLRASVVPRETVYLDAIDGGRVDRVMAEPGDYVQQGQPIVELSNTNLALSVIQQESQLNQAISQLQQNEIALEQNELTNERALAEIDYNLVRLKRSSTRRENLAANGATSVEQRDEIADELAYYQALKPIQTESSRRQSRLRERLLPDIHRQLDNLRSNLDIVRGKLDGLIIRAPITGRVTAIDLKVGELRAPGQRLAEVTPDAGMKLSAEIDEFYLSRVRTGQTATIEFEGRPMTVIVRRISPQVRNGQFTIDLEFESTSPPNLTPGATAQGRLQLGNDTPAVVLPVGPFLERTGGDWVFVVAPDGKSAERRRIKVGRRSTEQLEIMDGLKVGERVIVSDYTSLESADRIVLNN